jgi:hypothetical protein
MLRRIWKLKSGLRANCSLQHKKVIEDINSELGKIENLLTRYEPLLLKIKSQEPDFIEINALAMLLHSFYNGLENIFKRIAGKIDGQMPSGERSHVELLEQMAHPSNHRKDKLLSDETYKDLKKYLGFRHFSRHAYSFDLKRDLMKDLILRIDEIIKRSITEIRTFIEKLD